MPFVDAGPYSNLPFGDYTHEIARRLGCLVDEVDSIMLTAPQVRSSAFMAPNLVTGAIDNATGEKTFRIPGAIGKLISNIEVTYILDYFPGTAALQHQELRTRFAEPDLLASIDVSQSGERIGTGTQEREVQATAQVRVIQDWLAGSPTKGAYKLALENTTGLERQGSLVPTTLRRRTVRVAAADRNFVDRPLVAVTGVGILADSSLQTTFEYKDGLKKIVASAVAGGHPVGKRVQLWQMMPNDFLRTQQMLTCYSDTVIRVRNHPLTPVQICNHVPAGPANHGAVTKDEIEDGYAPANGHVVLKWQERYVSQPKFQAILDDVIGKEYVFPCFEIRGSQVTQLANESSMTGRCEVGPGRVHWALASLQAGDLPSYFPSNGKFFSDFVVDQMDLSMHGVEATNSEKQQSMKRRRYELSQLVFDNPRITENEFSLSHVVVVPIGYGAKTAGAGNLANKYHATHMREITVNCRTEDAAAAGILLTGIGKESTITFLGASTQTPGGKLLVKM